MCASSERMIIVSAPFIHVQQARARNGHSKNKNKVNVLVVTCLLHLENSDDAAMYMFIYVCECWVTTQKQKTTSYTGYWGSGPLFGQLNKGAPVVNITHVGQKPSQAFDSRNQVVLLIRVEHGNQKLAEWNRFWTSTSRCHTSMTSMVVGHWVMGPISVITRESVSRI